MKRLNINLKDRKILYGIFGIVIVCVFTLTIAYAALSVVLNISGNAEIVASSWDIKLANPKVISGSVNTNVPTISGNTLTFNTMLNTPGDYYEFTVDVVNNGSIDAMIDSVTKSPELTGEQAKYLNYIVEYQNGESINTKQLVSKNSFVRLKVRIEYKNDLTVSDLPTANTNLSLSLTLHYVQSDGSAINVNNNGSSSNSFISYGSLYDVGTVVTIGNEYFYTIGIEGNNVKLLSMFNLYVGNIVDEYRNKTPISNPTGMQNSTAKGLDWVFPFIGTTAFSSSTQQGINYSDYNGSIVEGYVNNYKTILESDYGVDVVEARLITKDELTDSETFACGVDDYCSDKYPWIYSTSYWAGPADGTDCVWSVYSDGYFASVSYHFDDFLGVRPVIVVSKDEFIISEDVTIEFNVADKVYQTEIGMTWYEWLNSSYNVDNFALFQDEISNESGGKILYIGDNDEDRVHPNYIIDPDIQYNWLILL